MSGGKPAQTLGMVGTKGSKHHRWGEKLIQPATLGIWDIWVWVKVLRLQIDRYFVDHFEDLKACWGAIKIDLYPYVQRECLQSK